MFAFLRRSRLVPHLAVAALLAALPAAAAALPMSGYSGRIDEFADADPVPIRLSLLVINDIPFAGVSGEILTNIGLRLKRESPLTRTMMLTHCNASSGYIPDDAAYEQVSYEVTTSRVKRGCAEAAIVNGFVEMLARLF
jgi:neutral ceramidase